MRKSYSHLKQREKNLENEPLRNHKNEPQRTTKIWDIFRWPNVQLELSSTLWDEEQNKSKHGSLWYFLIISITLRNNGKGWEDGSISKVLASQA